jgi:A/G-specific adenine glycosylase
MSSPDPLLPGEKRKLTRLRRDLLGWASREGRALPWRREDASPYQQVVVEVLLQRTTAPAVAKFYGAFFERFPGWKELAAAEPADLEEFLKPLGLWRRRASSLIGLAHYAIAAGGQFPRDQREHAQIPAVGQYVSNAIAMFYHGEARPLVDVNMARVIERFVRPRRLADIRHDPWLQEAAHWYARGPGARRANWAILDFAAAVCKARGPACEICPVGPRCAHLQKARANERRFSPPPANPRLHGHPLDEKGPS